MATNKKMIRVYKSFIGLNLSLIIILMLFLSCSKNEEDITCLNNGVYANGQCECPPFTMGKRCNIVLSAMHYGSYKGELDSILYSPESLISKRNRTISIKPYPNDFKKLLLWDQIYIELNENNIEFRIPIQSITDSRGATLTIMEGGRGFINKNNLRFVIILSGVNYFAVMEFDGNLE